MINPQIEETIIIVYHQRSECTFSKNRDGAFQDGAIQFLFRILFHKSVNIIGKRKERVRHRCQKKEDCKRRRG